MWATRGQAKNRQIRPKKKARMAVSMVFRDQKAEKTLPGILGAKPLSAKTRRLF